MTDLNDLRNRVLAKEPVSEEEYHLVVDSIRVSRRAAPAEKAKATRAAKKASVPAMDLSKLFAPAQVDKEAETNETDPIE